MIGSLNSRAGGALKGGIEVGSRVRIAAAACLVACGLLAGGASASTAFADSPLIGEDSGGKPSSGEKPKPNPDEKKTIPGVGQQPGGTGSEHTDKVGTDKNDPPVKDERDPKPGDETHGPEDGHKGESDNGKRDDNVTGVDPDNGNCSNGTNGCGGGNGNGDLDDPPTTPPTTKAITTTTQETTKEVPPPPPCDDKNKDRCSPVPPACDDKNKDHCSPGWPWWPFPWPWPPNPSEPPGQPPGPGGGGGGGHPEVPSGRPRVAPQMQLPPELMPPTTGPVGPTVVDAEPGVGIAAAQLPIAPITLPVIVAPATGLGGGGGTPGAPALPVTPRGVTAEPLAGREPLPANVGSNVAVPATSYRIGYTEYLRSAGLSQVAALAVPGVAGMLVLTGAGGLVGYRQAKAGHAVHTSGTARFVN
jgi:hypothetical protein